MKKIQAVWMFLFLFYGTFVFAIPQKKLTIILDTSLNTTHAPLSIAEEQGFFKEQGLKVQLLSPNHSSDSVNLITRNKADIGLAYEPTLIESVDRGLPIIRIGTLIDKPLNCIIALKRSGIKTLADLKGKEIGLAEDNLTHVILSTLLKKQGLSNKDVTEVNLPRNPTQALLSNKIEAASGTLRNLEVPMLETTGQQLVVFFPEEHGIPNYSELVFITNTANTKDPRFPKFLAAIKKAIQYLDQHPQEAWQQFTKQHPSLDTALNREYWFATMPYFAEDPIGFNPDEWRHFSDFMRHHNLISKKQKVSHYAVMVG